MDGQSVVKSERYMWQECGSVGCNVSRHMPYSHTLANMKCLAIQKVHTDDTEKRQERESFVIRKMRTVFPLGLDMQQ